ncbi:hypothetical protein EKK58_06375 [Candidatus Dependentiae bacterium]|nr:MAG: hypothetical protein EKK58_06375 [Candidatus Dependentiae bacterium]
MVKVDKRLLIFGCLALVKQSFGMEEQLAKTGLADPSKYIVIEQEKNCGEENSDDSYTPVLVVWQAGSNRMLPPCMHTMNKAVRYNVLFELETGQFINNQPNTLRVDTAVKDFIANKEPGHLTKLIKLLLDYKVSVSMTTTDLITQYLQQESIRLKDEWKMQAKTLVGIPDTHIQNQFNKLQNEITDKLIFFDSEATKRVALKLTVHNLCLASLKQEKEKQQEYTTEKVNNEIKLSEEINKYKKTYEKIQTHVAQIIKLLFELTNNTNLDQ